MSQPQVSVALGKLRELFSDAVFVRTTNGMQPTPRAAVLVKSAREVLPREGWPTQTFYYKSCHICTLVRTLP